MLINLLSSDTKSKFSEVSDAALKVSVFSRIQNEYRYLLCKSAYSVRMRENTDQKNSE